MCAASFSVNRTGFSSLPVGCFSPQILTPFLLRRLKSDVTLEVPPKKEIVVYAPLTSKQEAFYTAVVNKSIAKMLGQEKV